MKKILLFVLCLLTALMLVSCAAILAPGNDTNDSGEAPELTVEYVYNLAKSNGYSGTLEEFIETFKGEAGAPGQNGADGKDGVNGTDGKDGKDGEDGIGIKSVAVNSTGHLIIEYTNSQKHDAGLVIFTPDYEKITPIIGVNGNWYIGGEDTGVSASGEEGSVWYTGMSSPNTSLGVDGDFYISTATLNVYYKEGGMWGIVGSLSGGTAAGGSELSQAAISRGLLSSVSIRCKLTSASYQAGSGVIYSIDKTLGNAYIITNHHVVYNEKTYSIFSNDKISVNLYGMEYDDFSIPAVYVGGSADYDIAVLKITGSDIIKKSSARAALISDSDKIAVLDSVFAVGNPLGAGISATRGAVNVESEYTVSDNDVENRVMRIDAPVNSGNSGGGLFNTNGELVGIVNAKVMDSSVDNIGYAIPANIAVPLVENIIHYCDGTEYKNAKTITLGVQIAVADVSVEYDELTEKIVSKQKVKISKVTAGSLAEAAGLMAEDIILSIEHGGTEYEITKLYQVIDMKLILRQNDSIVYKIERDGAEMTKTINLPDVSHFTKIQ